MLALGFGSEAFHSRSFLISRVSKQWQESLNHFPQRWQPLYVSVMAPRPQTPRTLPKCLINLSI